MTLRQPLISIIVPVYNVAPYVPTFVESLSTACAAVGGGELEVIIVNDGSTDESMTIFNDLIARDAVLQPIVSVVNQDNGGSSVARNTGIEHAAGVWILPLDPDDFIAPDYIAKFHQAALRADRDVSIICGGITVWWSNRNMSVRPIETSSGYEATLMTMTMFSVTKLFRRQEIEARGLKYDPLVLNGEDSQFLFDYWGAVKGRVLPIDNVGYFYRQRQGSLSKTFRCDYVGKLRDYRLFRQSILRCVAANQLSGKVWLHWRKMLGCDLYDMIGDLRKSPHTRGRVAEILARDFTLDQIDDLKSFECSRIRRLLNHFLILSAKRRKKA